MEDLAVIFDMDGVIVDSEPVYRRLNKSIFKELDIKVDEDTQLSFIGGTTRRKWTILKEKFSLSQSVEELILLQHSIFSQEEWDFNRLLFPEALPLLMSLKQQGIPTALASSSDRKRIDLALEQCQLSEYFNEVICGEDFKNGKPHPDIFLHSAEKLGISPTSCVVIEDSHNGLTAAKRANMYSIGVKHKQINMDLSLANQIVNSLSEINLEKLKELFKIPNVKNDMLSRK